MCVPQSKTPASSALFPPSDRRADDSAASSVAVAAAAPVMISYCSEDRSIAFEACEVLEARGLRCWIAPRDIVPGREWAGAIMSAIRNARVMVLIYTARCNDSPQVRREVERAVARGLHVIPVRVEDVDMSPTLEYFISAPHWLDALVPPMGQHLERLAENVRELLATAPVAEATPAGDPAGRTAAATIDAVELGTAVTTKTSLPAETFAESSTRGAFARAMPATAYALSRAVSVLALTLQALRGLR